MKKLIINILKFVLFFILIVTILGLINYKFTYPSNYFQLPTKKKYVVIGDSHTECSFFDYNDEYVNLSQSGEIYFYSYLKLKEIFKLNKGIKIVFIDFCNSQIDKSQDSFFWSNDSYLLSRYTIYHPFFDYSTYKLLLSNNFNGTLKAHFNSSFKGIGNIIFNKNVLQDKLVGGHVQLTSVLNNKSINNKHPSNSFYSSKTNLCNLDKIINLCNSNNVKVYLIRCPLHTKWEYLRNDQLFDDIRKKRYSKIDFLDFKNFPINSNEFADYEHLNKHGAIKFSSFFYAIINENLLNQIDKQKFIEAKINEINNFD